MNEDVPICHCAEYYGSHAPDCPIAAEVRALRKDRERLDWILLNCSLVTNAEFFEKPRAWNRPAIDAAMAREGRGDESAS